MAIRKRGPGHCAHGIPKMLESHALLITIVYRERCQMAQRPQDLAVMSSQILRDTHPARSQRFVWRAMLKESDQSVR